MDVYVYMDTDDAAAQQCAAADAAVRYPGARVLYRNASLYGSRTAALVPSGLAVVYVRRRHEQIVADAQHVGVSVRFIEQCEHRLRTKLKVA